MSTVTYFDLETYSFRVLPKCRWLETFSAGGGPCEKPRVREDYKRTVKNVLIGDEVRRMDTIAFFDNIPMSAFCEEHRRAAEQYEQAEQDMRRWNSRFMDREIPR